MPFLAKQMPALLDHQRSPAAVLIRRRVSGLGRTGRVWQACCAEARSEAQGRAVGDPESPRGKAEGLSRSRRSHMPVQLETALNSQHILP